MRARSTLKPGKPGTLKLVAQYGDRLLNVRYPYDALQRRRYTTAEIIVAETEWDPLPSATARKQPVPVRIALQETGLRTKVKMAGGKWNPKEQVWTLSMEQVIQLGLANRVVGRQHPPEKVGKGTAEEQPRNGEPF